MQPPQRSYFSNTEQIFSKFPDIPFDVRFLIWERCLPKPRVIRVDLHISQTGYKQWKTRTLRPAILSVCQESRKIASRRYKFCSGPDVCLWLDPSIDTLYFGATGSDLDFLDFLVAAKERDVKILRNLAINEMHLAAWSEMGKHRNELISSALSPVMEALERLMIGLQVPSLDYHPNNHLAPDEWEGWLFGGGPITAEEKLIHNGDLPDLAFSPDSLNHHLFHLTNSPEYPEKYPGVVPLSLIKLFSFYYPLELAAKGQRREVVARLGPWYRRIFRRLAKMDVRMMRLFEMEMSNRESDAALSGGRLPLVACFVMPAESFRCWEDSLEPLCGGDWVGDRELNSVER